MAHFSLLKVSVLVVLATTAQANLRGYGHPSRHTPFLRNSPDAFGGNGGFSGTNTGFSGGNGGFSRGNSGFSGGNGGFSGGNGGFSGGNGGFSSGNTGLPSNEIANSASFRFSIEGCPEGQARKADGSCAKAQITRNLFLYAPPPAQQVQVGPAPNLPDPKVHYNFVFVRTPQVLGASRPVVVPPPQQKTLVYVLTKRPGVQDQEIIEVPSTPTQPEVYFVNYAPGDNPELPGGINLQQALSQSAQQGQIIDGDAGGAGGGVGGGSIGGGISGGNIGGVGGGLSGGSIGGGLSGGDFREGSFGGGTRNGGLFGNEDTDEGTQSNTGGSAGVPDVEIILPGALARGTGVEGFEQSNEVASSSTGSISVPSNTYSTPV